MKTMLTKREAYASLFNSASDVFQEMLAEVDCEGDVEQAAFDTIEHLADARKVIRAQADSQEPTPADSPPIETRPGPTQKGE